MTSSKPANNVWHKHTQADAFNDAGYELSLPVQLAVGNTLSGSDNLRSMKMMQLQQTL